MSKTEQAARPEVVPTDASALWEASMAKAKVHDVRVHLAELIGRALPDLDGSSETEHVVLGVALVEAAQAKIDPMIGVATPVLQQMHSLLSRGSEIQVAVPIEVGCDQIPNFVGCT